MANPPGAGEPVVRRRLIYRGRVQGVGFRYTVRSIAARFLVAGWVRNLDDGTVELVAEADAGELARFLDAVAESLAANIAEVDEREDALNELLGDRFEIRF